MICFSQPSIKRWLIFYTYMYDFPYAIPSKHQYSLYLAKIIVQISKVVFCDFWIRQRGIGNPNPVKLGRCIKELERIYGIQNGNNQYERLPKVSEGKILNQSDIAEMIGISVDTLNNYKKLTELIPELEDLVDPGILAPTTELVSPKVSDSPKWNKM